MLIIYIATGAFLIGGLIILLDGALAQKKK